MDRRLFAFVLILWIYSISALAANSFEPSCEEFFATPQEEVDFMLDRISEVYGVKFHFHPQPPCSPNYFATSHGDEFLCFLPEQYFSDPEKTYFHLVEFEEILSIHKHLAETENVPFPSVVSTNHEIQLSTPNPRPGSVMEWIMTRVKRHQLQVFIAPESHFQGSYSEAGGYAQGNRIYLRRSLGKTLETSATKGLIAHELLHGATTYDCERNYLKCGKMIGFHSQDVNLFAGQLQEGFQPESVGIDLAIYPVLYGSYFRSDEVEAYRLSRHFATAPRKRAEYRQAILKFGITQGLVLKEVLRGLNASQYNFVENQSSTVTVPFRGGSVQVKLPYEAFEDEESARTYYKLMVLERLRQLRNHLKIVYAQE